MSKYTLLVVLFLSLVLIGCTGASPTTEPQPPTVESPVDTPVPDTPIPMVTATKTQKIETESGGKMACNVVGLLPPLDPTQAALFPPVGDDEWAKGAENPYVTIVEYGDFQ